MYIRIYVRIVHILCVNIILQNVPIYIHIKVYRSYAILLRWYWKTDRWPKPRHICRRTRGSLRQQMHPRRARSHRSLASPAIPAWPIHRPLFVPSCPARWVPFSQHPARDWWKRPRETSTPNHSLRPSDQTVKCTVEKHSSLFLFEACIWDGFSIKWFSIPLLFRFRMSAWRGTFFHPPRRHSRSSLTSVWSWSWPLGPRTDSDSFT